MECRRHRTGPDSDEIPRRRRRTGLVGDSQTDLDSDGWPIQACFWLEWGSSTARQRLHLPSLQLTRSAAKLGARVGAVHEKTLPDGASAFIDNKIKQLGDWRG